ncbi:unnamed protein product [Nyctereutes procyonoides]|uniref:Translationally-controlled tumor protein n=1 Tax=Nyctereutes procyonoides TaxID=34880 RepID=A0A811ZVR3_NYCPR|nr:unnamed protein product [Nyctereutes procyonoides]
MVSRTEGNIDDLLTGGNASTEVITGVDIVMNHYLQETSFTKEAYKKQTLKTEARKSKTFYDRASEQIKHILINFKNDLFIIGENMNPDGMVALLDYCEDGVTPNMIFFKGGLEMEKS